MATAVRCMGSADSGFVSLYAARTAALAGDQRITEPSAATLTTSPARPGTIASTSAPWLPLAVSRGLPS
jgi:hypothetical protein